MMTCETCDGTGCGPCASCGDDFMECACDNPEPGECDACEGSGQVEDDE